MKRKQTQKEVEPVDELNFVNMSTMPFLKIKYRKITRIWITVIAVMIITAITVITYVDNIFYVQEIEATLVSETSVVGEFIGIPPESSASVPCAESATPILVDDTNLTVYKSGNLEEIFVSSKLPGSYLDKYMFECDKNRLYSRDNEYYKVSILCKTDISNIYTVYNIPYFCEDQEQNNSENKSQVNNEFKISKLFEFSTEINDILGEDETGHIIGLSYDKKRLIKQSLSGDIILEKSLDNPATLTSVAGYDKYIWGCDSESYFFVDLDTFEVSNRTQFNHSINLDEVNFFDDLYINISDCYDSKYLLNFVSIEDELFNINKHDQYMTLVYDSDHGTSYPVTKGVSLHNKVLRFDANESDYKLKGEYTPVCYTYPFVEFGYFYFTKYNTEDRESKFFYLCVSGDDGFNLNKLLKVNNINDKIRFVIPNIEKDYIHYICDSSIYKSVLLSAYRIHSDCMRLKK